MFTEQLSPDSYTRKLENIFNEFWEREVLNVIVIFWTEKLKCFTYTPFGNSILIPLNTNETDPKRSFYDKINHLMGHEIRIGMFNDPQRARIVQIGDEPKLRGFDGGFGGMVMKRMNATFKIIQPLDGANLGEFFSNGSSNGIFGLLKTIYVDMSFNARFYRMQHFRGIIEPTVISGRGDLCIMVPWTDFSLNLDSMFDTFMTVAKSLYSNDLFVIVRSDQSTNIYGSIAQVL